MANRLRRFGAGVACATLAVDLTGQAWVKPGHDGFYWGGCRLVIGDCPPAGVGLLVEEGEAALEVVAAGEVGLGEAAAEGLDEGDAGEQAVGLDGER